MLIGREKELEQLRQAIARLDTCFIYGPSGIGRRELAHEASRDQRRNVVIVSGRSTRELTAGLVAHMPRVMGRHEVLSSSHLLDSISGWLNDTAEDARPIVIIEELSNNVRVPDCLPRRTLPVLATTHPGYLADLADAMHLELGPLTPPLAKELFRRLTGWPEARSEQWSQYLGGCPYVLHRAAGLARSFDWRYANLEGSVQRAAPDYQKARCMAQAVAQVLAAQSPLAWKMVRALVASAPTAFPTEALSVIVTDATVPNGNAQREAIQLLRNLGILRPGVTAEADDQDGLASAYYVSGADRHHMGTYIQATHNWNEAVTDAVRALRHPPGTNEASWHDVQQWMPHWRSLVEDSRATLSPEDRAWLLHEYGYGLKFGGDLREAREFLVLALDTLSACDTHNAESWSSLKRHITGNLAHCLYELGIYEEARRLFEDLKEFWLNRWNDQVAAGKARAELVETACSLINATNELSAVQSRMGNTVEARLTAIDGTDLATQCTTVIGDDEHLLDHVQHAYGALGTRCLRAWRARPDDWSTDALSAFDRSLQILRRLPGDRRADIFSRCVSMATVYALVGRQQESDQAIDEATRVGGEQYSLADWQHGLLGLWYAIKGLMSEAEVSLDVARQMRRARNGVPSHDFILDIVALADTLNCQNPHSPTTMWLLELAWRLASEEGVDPSTRNDVAFLGESLAHLPHQAGEREIWMGRRQDARRDMSAN